MKSIFIWDVHIHCNAFMRNIYFSLPLPVFNHFLWTQVFWFPKMVWWAPSVPVVIRNMSSSCHRNMSTAVRSLAFMISVSWRRVLSACLALELLRHHRKAASDSGTGEALHAYIVGWVTKITCPHYNMCEVLWPTPHEANALTLWRLWGRSALLCHGLCRAPADVIDLQRVKVVVCAVLAAEWSHFIKHNYAILSMCYIWIWI